MFVVIPVGFYDVERNLSAPDLTSLNLAYTCGCKAKVHVKSGGSDMSSFCKLMEDNSAGCPPGGMTNQEGNMKNFQGASEALILGK